MSAQHTTASMALMISPILAPLCFPLLAATVGVPNSFRAGVVLSLLSVSSTPALHLARAGLGAAQGSTATRRTLLWGWPDPKPAELPQPALSQRVSSSTQIEEPAEGAPAWLMTGFIDGLLAIPLSLSKRASTDASNWLISFQYSAGRASEGPGVAAAVAILSQVSSSILLQSLAAMAAAELRRQDAGRLIGLAFSLCGVALGVAPSFVRSLCAWWARVYAAAGVTDEFVLLMPYAMLLALLVLTWTIVGCGVLDDDDDDEGDDDEEEDTSQHNNA